MSDVTPAGPISVAVDGLRTLIANVPFFQTWTGAVSVNDALTKIFAGEVGFPVAAISVVAGVLTITTREPHNLAVGTATLAGSASGPQGANVDGVIAILSVPTSNTLTAATAVADQAVDPHFAFIFQGQRPIAVISDGDDALHSQSIGTGGASTLSGAVNILLEADISSGNRNDPLNARYEARNAVGQFHQGLIQTQSTTDLMCLNECSPIGGIEFTTAQEQDDNTVIYERWRARLRVTWGLL